MAQFSPADTAKLHGLDPRLQRVLNRAILGTPFMIVQGARTKEEAWANWGKGRSPAECAAHGVPTKYSHPEMRKVTWLSHPLGSRHIPNPETGYAEAVDCAPLPLNWNDVEGFRKLASIMAACALAETVRITWGGEWSSSPDFPHYELTR